MVTGYGLVGPGSIPSLLPSGYRGLFYGGGVKRQGPEADHSPPSSAEVKNGGAIPPLPHMFSWHSAVTNEEQDSFAFYFIAVEAEVHITPRPLVHKRTIPTERPPHVGEVSANFCG
jgi:hypothetical protein